MTDQGLRGPGITLVVSRNKHVRSVRLEIVGLACSHPKFSGNNTFHASIVHAVHMQIEE